MKGMHFKVLSESFFDKQNIRSVLNNIFIYSIIIGSCFIKIPQLSKIVSKKNVSGLSFVSVYLETLVATSLIVFSIKEKLNIKLFIDVILINTQNILIILLMWKYSYKYSKRIKFLKAVLYVFFFLFLLFVLPDALAHLLGFVSAPLSCFSKIPQIYINYKNQNTGTLSFVTCFLIFCGNLARIYVILYNLNNRIYLILYYWKNTKKISAKNDKKKQL
ncbi:PQ loop repeat family protein [Plasmodium gonderi]|uniref:PQ loop repeat family protein n=1 Tax=Plasmodium gonderi TaxID=77519 RepID=A0A1Y1JF32_PLAGO|nr:PQ loop repeat family protein [Plasmodium gonderi]GAW81116.1 PQ loop repeat family protein [Plasmodium gonderi]